MASIDTPLAKRLLAYSAAAGVTMALATPADAQVVYTDVDPDLTVGAGESYSLDVDGDGTVDFTVRQNAGAGTGTQARVRLDNANSAATNNGVLGRVAPYFGNSQFASIYNVASNDEISDADAFFPAGVAASIYNNNPYYPFIDSEGRVGFRFTAGGGTTHYGWLGMAVNADATTFTIQGFAYESTPNTAIAAGDVGGTTATAPDALADGYRFSPLAPNPVAGRSRFEVGVGQTESVKIEVFDALGRSQVVLHDGLLAGGAAQPFTLDSGTLPSGVYVVRVTGESFDSSRTVTILR